MFKKVILQGQMMPKSKRGLFLFVSIALFFFLLAAVAFSPWRTTLLFLPPDQRPESVIAQLVDELGGLPKTSVDLDEGVPPALSTFPIAHWEIIRVSVRPDRSLAASLLDDDPTFGYEIDLDVVYRDGDVARLRWRSWRFGRVLHSIVLLTGTGPPGELTRLHTEENK